MWPNPDDARPPRPGDPPQPPALQYSVPCDDFRQEIGGKFLLVGVFETVRGESFPVTRPAVYIVNRWVGGVGEFVERTRIVGPSGQLVVEGRDLAFALPEAAGGYTVVTRFAHLTFPEPGTYWVEVLLDGDVRRRYPLVAEQEAEP